MATDPRHVDFATLDLSVLDNRELLLVAAERVAGLTWQSPADAVDNDQHLITRLREIATELLDADQPTPTIFDTQGAVYDAMGLGQRPPRLRDRLGAALRAFRAWVKGRGQ